MKRNHFSAQGKDSTKGHDSDEVENARLRAFFLFFLLSMDGDWG